jgi:hypothetical protein
MSANLTDVFQLKNENNILLIFDCPSKDPSAYQKFSEEILSNTHEVAILFFDMDIPKEFLKIAQANISAKLASE